MTSAPRAIALRTRRPTAVLLASIALLPLALGGAGCAHKKEEALVPAAAPPTHLAIAGRTVTVELALDGDQRAKGLMGRTHLDEDAGMLFIFTETRPQNFWMKNTLIPLDIIFLDADGTVQNVEDALPGVEKPGYQSDRPARMVLELNEGWCGRHGLKPGDRISVPPELLTRAKP